MPDSHGLSGQSMFFNISKRNKSDGKSGDTTFTSMWDIKLKVTTEQTKTHRHRPQYGGYQRERRAVKKGKGDFTSGGEYTMQ